MEKIKANKVKLYDKKILELLSKQICTNLHQKDIFGIFDANQIKLTELEPESDEFMFAKSRILENKLNELNNEKEIKTIHKLINCTIDLLYFNLDKERFLSYIESIKYLVERAGFHAMDYGKDDELEVLEDDEYFGLFQTSDEIKKEVESNDEKLLTHIKSNSKVLIKIINYYYQFMRIVVTASHYDNYSNLLNDAYVFLLKELIKDIEFLDLNNNRSRSGGLRFSLYVPFQSLYSAEAEFKAPLRLIWTKIRPEIKKIEGKIYEVYKVVNSINSIGRLPEYSDEKLSKIINIINKEQERNNLAENKIPPSLTDENTVYLFNKNIFITKNKIHYKFNNTYLEIRIDKSVKTILIFLIKMGKGNIDNWQRKKDLVRKLDIKEKTISNAFTKIRDAQKKIDIDLIEERGEDKEGREYRVNPNVIT